MKKSLDTVSIVAPGALLRKEGENLVAEVEDKEQARVPSYMRVLIGVFGGLSVSPALIAASAQGGIAIVRLDGNGRFQARIETSVFGNVLLRRTQYGVSEEPADIVRSLLLAKVL